MTELRLQSNRSIVSDERDSNGRAQDLIVRAHLIAPDQKTSAERRLPLHIAIVIDRSGSMSGRKLEDAIAAAQRMVGRLDDEDRCVVVAFDTTVSLLADGAPLSTARREMISHALSLVQAGSSTNLAGGWDVAVRALLLHHQPNMCISRVVLLTDGAANVGISDRDSLAAQANIYADLGVSTSTYGLGQHYNEATLTAISQAGLGNHQFIEVSSDIDDFFGQELRELFAVALTDVTVTAQLPAGYRFELIGDQRHTITQQTLRIDIGALVALEQRSYYLRLTPLSLTPHGQHTVTLQLTGTDTTGTQQHATATAEWTLTNAQGALHAVVHRDIEEQATLIDLARVRAEANRLNDEGRYNDAQAFIHAQQARSTIFAKVQLYDEAARLFAQPTSAAFRKDEASRGFRRQRFSSKDLGLLKQRLAAKQRAGAPAHEIAAIEDEIAEFLRLAGWTDRS